MTYSLITIKTSDGNLIAAISQTIPYSNPMAQKIQYTHKMVIASRDVTGLAVVTLSLMVSLWIFAIWINSSFQTMNYFPLPRLSLSIHKGVLSLQVIFRQMVYYVLLLPT